MQDMDPRFGASETSRELHRAEEKFAKLILSTGDPRTLQCRPNHKETKPHRGMDVLSGCCLAFPPSPALPFPEDAGHLAQVASCDGTSVM